MSVSELNSKSYGLNKLREICNNLRTKTCHATAHDYMQAVQKVYGTQKVQDVCARYDLFHKTYQASQPLKKKEVRQIQQGLNEIRGSDLDKFLIKLQQNASLSEKEKDIQESLGSETVQKLLSYSSSSELPVPLFNTLLHAFKQPNPSYKDVEFRNNQPLVKITALPKKYLHAWISHLKGRSIEDAERLKMSEEIQTLATNDRSRYCEILSKILVKKHLYFEQPDSNKEELNMLIPAPRGPGGEERWYRVSEMIDSGWGKFAYRLIPATSHYADDMPDILVYRSSATYPTARDSFTSLLSDFNVLPPGYLSRNFCKKKELRWFSESSKAATGKMRPLIVAGHSLGGSNCQVALMNLSTSGKWVDRPIFFEIFDSPAISAADAQEFAQWYDKQNFNQPLLFNYYVSEGDLVPLAGSFLSSTYLGNYIQKANSKSSLKNMTLTDAGLAKEELAGLGSHGRMFFRGKKGVDFKVTRMTITQYDNEKKYSRIALNIIKIVGIVLAWGTFGIIGGIKRFFLGRRHHDALIVKVFRKVSKNFSKLHLRIKNYLNSFLPQTAL